MHIPAPEASPPDELVELGRFHVRWFREHCFLGTGWAVCDGGKRITICWPDKDEAQKHLEEITRLYARYGW